MKGKTRTLAGVLALAGVLILPAVASAGDGGFAAAQKLPVSHPYGLATGDFNRDGRPDLAAVDGTKGEIAILLRSALGGFTPAAPVPATVFARLLVVGDWNADGNDDLALGSFDDHVNIFVGTGGGGFFKLPDVVLGSYPRSLEVADVNRDGREDLVAGVGAGDTNAVSVRLGNGNGSFSTVPDTPGPAGPLALGDFNNDASEDLAMGSGEPVGRVLLGLGTGGFQAPKSFPLPQPADIRSAWAVADFNGDRHQDVAVMLPTNVVSVRLGIGDGTFGSAKNVSVGPMPRALAVGDFNSDGKEDFVVGDWKDGKVRVRLGDGAGGFRPGADVQTGAGALQIVVADFNGGGTDDLAIATSSDDTLKLHLGTGPSPLAGNKLVNGGFEGALPTANLDGAEPIRGWQRTGAMTFVRYGFPSHAWFPARLSAPRYLTGGNSLLWGGKSTPTGGVTTAFQGVDVSSSATAIDAGRVTANLSAYLGGALEALDRMTVTARFINATGGSLGTFSLGPVTAAQRNNLTTLLRRVARRAVPAGTRRIRVTLRSDDADKTYSSATADNVKLTLTTTTAASR